MESIKPETEKAETDKNSYKEMEELFNRNIIKLPIGQFDPRVQGFYAEMKEKYPDTYHKYSLWHLITGSTPRGNETGLDTPDGDMEDFIKNQLPAMAEKQQ